MSIKLNLGCGDKKLDGFVSACKADYCRRLTNV